MAQLGFNGGFDATQVDPSSTFDPVPPDDYLVQVINSEMKPTKDGQGQYLQLEMDILDGEYQGRKVFDRLNLLNNNPQTVEIAQRTLSAICHATGVLNVQDSEQLHFIPMIVKVVVKPAQGQYSASNEVKGYKPVNGGQQQGGGAPAPQQQRSQQQMQQPQQQQRPMQTQGQQATTQQQRPNNTGGTAPWKRGR